MRALPSLLLMSISGCFAVEDMSELLPDERIQVNLPTQADGAKGEGDPSDWYLFTASTTADINGMIGAVLFWVESLRTGYQPTAVDDDADTVEWGPWATALDPVETLLWICHDPLLDVHDWGFDQWPLGQPREQARTVIRGEVDPGASPQRSSGRFEVDLTTIHALDPTEELTGGFAVEYEIQADGVSATASFLDLGPEGLEASYAYQQDFAGGGRMDLVILGDIDPGGGSGLEETWYTRSRWQPSGAGRADVRITGGDLGAGVATVSECWSTTFEAVFHSDSLSGVSWGDPGRCAFDEAEYSD